VISKRVFKSMNHKIIMKRVIIIGIVIIIVAVIASGIYLYPFEEIEEEKSGELICTQDSDCIIFDKSGGCPMALHKDDIEGRIGPPSLASCPPSSHFTAYCLDGNCRQKIDCSKCDILKEFYEDSCFEKESFSCNGYRSCNC